MSPLPPITTMPYLLVRRMRGCVRSPQVTNRAKAGGRRRPADHLLRPPCDLLAAHVKGYTVMVNSIFNGWRMEDVWLDK